MLYMNSYCKMIESNKDLLAFGTKPSAMELERIEKEYWEQKFNEQDWELDLTVPKSRSALEKSRLALETSS